MIISCAASDIGGSETLCPQCTRSSDTDGILWLSEFHRGSFFHVGTKNCCKLQ